MKKIIFIAMSVTALFACSKINQENEILLEKKVVSVDFTSAKPQLDVDTKTAWDASSKSIVWSEGDRIKVAYSFTTTSGTTWGHNDKDTKARLYTSADVKIEGNDGTFTVNELTFDAETESGTYQYYTLYPYSLVSSTDFDAPIVKVSLPATQNPISNSFDAAADVMVGAAEEAYTAVPTTAVPILWQRIVAHADLTFKNIAFDGEESISKIILTANEGAAINGSFNIDITTGEVTATETTTNVIAISGANLVADGNNVEAWVSMLPATITALDIEIQTNKAKYVRSITGISKTFKKNARNVLGVDMASATRTAVESVEWVKKDISQISDADVFVIVGNNGSGTYAMSNDKGTNGAPTATKVTISGNKLSSNPVDELQWNLASSSSGYTFYPNGNHEIWLYCTNTNNGVRVGTNTNNVFTIDQGYLKHSGTSRHVGIYNSQDWRCYSPSGNTIHNNISGQTFAFYVRSASGTVPTLLTPELSFNTPTTTVNVGETVTNVATIDPSDLTVTYSSSDEAVATVTNAGVVTGVAAGSATITASFAGNAEYDAATASYNITVVAPIVNHGSVDDPMSPEEIVTVIDDLEAGEVTTDFYYVEGVLDADPSYFGNGKLTFTFVDSEGNNQIKAYNCKGLNGANFTAITDLKEGDCVIVYGNLEKYVKNDVVTYEVVNGQLAKLITPVVAGSITVTANDFGTSYAAGSFTKNGITFSYADVADFGNGIQFKKTSGALYNSTSLGTIKKITITETSGAHTNLILYAGTSADDTTTEISATNLVYDFSGMSYGYFKFSNGTGAAYLDSITIEYE